MGHFPPVRTAAIAIATACGLLPGAVSGATLQRSAIGDVAPGTTQAPGVVTNGDFEIFRIGNDGSLIGDGIDEHTFWIHDFSADPDLAAFESATELLRATLRLTLTPPVSPVSDRAAIFGLAEFQATQIDTLQVGVTQTIEIDLLEIYGASLILSQLFGSSPSFDPRIPASGPGQLTVGYANDAIVSFAELTLVTVPEPGTALLVLLGLVRMAARVRSHPHVVQ